MALSDAIRQSAARLGVDPLDLATVISFETGGTFSPSIYGGGGKRHLGLIQFNPANAKRYGAHPGQTAEEQLSAVERYLTATGVKPGMDRTHLYAAILAGSPYKQNISDTKQGGTPGGAAQKVRDQMSAHERKAQALLGGATQRAVTPAATVAQQAAAQQTPVTQYPDSPLIDRGVLGSENPWLKLADERKEQQQQAQIQQLQARAQAPPEPDPQPVPQPAAPPMDFAALMFPRIRRGLLSDDNPYSMGLLGAA